MLSVVIPVLNESERITSVVQFIASHPRVTEVIVVDDGSTDGTRELASAAGATVITSTLLGKGASMQDGLRVAKNELVVFLDGDLNGLHADTLDRLTQPLRAGEADFVKARFSQTGCRLSVLTVKPLLQTFFPEVAHFNQPLGGIVAARRSLLERLRFETDCGVDIGLLLDAANLGAKLVEVDIDHVEHDNKPLEVLGDRATQIARTILEYAARYGRLHTSQLVEVRDIEHRTKGELDSIIRKVGKTERLALFDLDRVLLEGQFVVELARRCGKSDELHRYLNHPHMHQEARTRTIAAIFNGVSREIFEQTAREMPLTEGSTEAVVGLRTLGYRVGIVTDSFMVAAETVRRRVFADFSVAHVMKFRSGKATGQILLAAAMAHPQGCPRHRLCKVNVMWHLTHHLGLSPSQVLAIGAGENDICLLETAGLSFAFRPLTPSVAAAGKHILLAPLSTLVDNAVILAMTS